MERQEPSNGTIVKIYDFTGEEFSVDPRKSQQSAAPPNNTHKIKMSGKASLRCILGFSVLLLNLISVFSFVKPHLSRQPSTSVMKGSEDHRCEVLSTSSEILMSPSYSTLVVSPRLSPLEAWCVTHMDVWYSQSLSIKCPFLKRRTADVLDALDMMMRFLVIRHKSLDLIGPPPGCRSAKMSQAKRLDTSLDERMDIIRQDWRPSTSKGYYITGRLNSTIYRDDCLFDGPDPDMPVRGLRKYVNAASNLFDHASSTADLLSMNVEEAENGNSVILVEWRLQGVLHLPWHPKLPQWTGRTRYYFDESGLICRHEEEWDISVAQAFLETLLPDLARNIWGETVTDGRSSSSGSGAMEEVRR
jgi:hypothetical protein